MQVCHHSGECLAASSATTWDDPSLAATPGPPPPPAAGYFEYGNWGDCSQTCNGEQGVQLRTAVCHGDCSQLPAAVLQRTCADKPCITACDSNPCGEDNLCSAQTASDGTSVAVTCLCTDGSTGDYCHLSSSSCHMDISNRCCPIDRDLSITGECCSADMALDTFGLCCPIASLDGCGVCNGDGVMLDSLGRCCPVATTDANGACCLGSQVDACGTLS